MSRRDGIAEGRERYAPAGRAAVTPQGGVSRDSHESGYLLGLVKLLRQDLLQAADASAGLVDPRLEWLGDRLVEAELLVDFLEGPELHGRLLDWCDGVRARHEGLHAENAGDGS